jgi:hypothetical protein
LCCILSCTATWLLLLLLLLLLVTKHALKKLELG